MKWAPIPFARNASCVADGENVAAAMRSAREQLVMEQVIGPRRDRGGRR
jgi:hypothetical protein